MRLLCKITVGLFLLISSQLLSAAPVSGTSIHSNRYLSGSNLPGDNLLNGYRYHEPYLRVFMNALPKGGNLHHHLMGAIEPSDLIQEAINQKLCIDSELVFVKCDGTTTSVQDFIKDGSQHDKLLKSLSDPDSNGETLDRNSHFFNYFGKVALLFDGLNPAFLNLVRHKAAADQLLYIESTIYWNEYSGPGQLFKLLDDLPSVDPTDGSSLEGFRAALTQKVEFQSQLTLALQEASNALKQSDSILQCNTTSAKPGCNVTVRFLHEIHRTDTLPRVYAQMIFSFALAQKSMTVGNSEVLGINIVGPENDPTSLADYSSHMTMLKFLKDHPDYPAVSKHITLHAGELVESLASETYVQSTLGEAIQTVMPARIGHGLSLVKQICPGAGNTLVACTKKLLETMTSNDIAIEIPFTSNERLQGVNPNTHPFPIYVASGVPVTLATDDPGVLQIDLTSQFVKAIIDYNSYQNNGTYVVGMEQIIEFTRNSLELSFLPGKSLWLTDIPGSRYQTRVPQCTDIHSPQCDTYVENSLKAKVQRQHEDLLTTFLSSETQNNIQSTMTNKHRPGTL